MIEQQIEMGLKLLGSVEGCWRAKRLISWMGNAAVSCGGRSRE